LGPSDVGVGKQQPFAIGIDDVLSAKVKIETGHRRSLTGETENVVAMAEGRTCKSNRVSEERVAAG
jgi:hypothetical protein